MIYQGQGGGRASLDFLVELNLHDILLQHICLGTILARLHSPRVYYLYGHLYTQISIFMYLLIIFPLL